MTHILQHLNFADRKTGNEHMSMRRAEHFPKEKKIEWWDFMRWAAGLVIKQVLAAIHVLR